MIYPKAVYPKTKFKVKVPYQERQVKKNDELYVSKPIVSYNKKANIRHSITVHKTYTKYIPVQVNSIVNNYTNNYSTINNEYTSDMSSFDLIPNIGLSVANGVVVYSTLESVTFQQFVGGKLDNSFTLRRNDFYIKYDLNMISIYSYSSHLPIIYDSIERWVNFPGLTTSQIVEKIIKA